MLHRLLGIVALIALLAASGGSPAAPEPTSATVPTSVPAFSVQTHTITHALGEIDVPVSPQRIVVLDYNTVEELIALGITPIGVLYDPPPWLAPSLTGVEVVGNDGQPNIEKILLLKPDLIIGWPPLMGDATYENLATIAPTVILEKPSFAVWKQTFRYLADVVGKQQVAEDLLNTYSSRTAELRERIGEETTRQLQVSFFRVTGDGSALRVAGVNSFAGSVLADIGFDRPPAQKNSADEELEISLERLDLADGDVLFVGARQDNPDSVRVVEQLKTNPLWLTLSAVKAQRVFDVDSNRWLEGSILNATFILADLERHLSSGITNVPATTIRTVTDDLGRSVEIPANPQRIVALHDLQVLRPLLDLGVTPIASVTHPRAEGAYRGSGDAPDHARPGRDRGASEPAASRGGRLQRERGPRRAGCDAGGCPHPHSCRRACAGISLDRSVRYMRLYVPQVLESS